MSERQAKTYGLSGEPETRLELEFDFIYKNKLDILEKKFSVPNPGTVAQGKPTLVKAGGIWYIYIRIDDKWYRTALTAV